MLNRDLSRGVASIFSWCLLSMITESIERPARTNTATRPPGPDHRNCPEANFACLWYCHAVLPNLSCYLGHRRTLTFQKTAYPTT